MPTDLAGTPTFRPVTSVPTAGDLRNATSVLLPFQQLTDSAAYLKGQTDTLTTNLTSGLASTNVALAELARTPALTWGPTFSTITSSGIGTGAVDQPLMIAAGDAIVMRGTGNAWWFYSVPGNGAGFINTPGSMADPGFAPANMDYANGTLVAMGSATSSLVKSTNLGVSWSSAGTYSTGCNVIGHSNIGSRWMVAGASTAIGISTDLATWSSTSNPIGGGKTLLGFFDAWSQATILLVPQQIGFGQTPSKVGVSTNGGVGWVASNDIPITGGGPVNLAGAVWSPYHSLWVLTSTQGNCWTSPDGVTWTEHNVGGLALGPVAALGPTLVSISGSYLAWSPNGSAWYRLNVNPNAVGGWAALRQIDNRSPSNAARLVVAHRNAGELELRFSDRLSSTLYGVTY